MEDNLGASGERLSTVVEELNEVKVEDTQMSLVDAQGNPTATEPEVEEDVQIETQPEDAQQAQPAGEMKTLPDLACGYVVGVQPTGEFVFEVLGNDQGLVQLLGLHAYAKHRLEVAKDINQGYGVPLLNSQLTQVQQMLKVMINMMTQQSKDNLTAQLKR